MPETSLEDYLLDAMVGLANHHGDQFERCGNTVQTLAGDIFLSFKNLKYGERTAGNFVMLATVQISAPSLSIADIYDSLLEGGPTTDIPIQHTIMEAYHLFQFVKNVLHGTAKADTEIALANTSGTRSFKVYFYGPIVRADSDKTRALLEKKLEDSWVYKKVFSGIPSAFVDFRPYWVKVNHLKSGDANIPECRLDEREWPEVQSQIATFQWPSDDGLMGYKQFIIFVPAKKI